MEETDSSMKSSIAEERRLTSTDTCKCMCVDVCNAFLIRKRMMQQISDMQKKFFEEHKDELELIEKVPKPERQSVTLQHHSLSCH